MKIKHRFSIISILAVLALVCASTALILTGCGGDHTHVYSNDWKYDETNHWHYCTVSGCDEISGVSEHTYDYDNYTTTDDGKYVYTCTECGYQITESAAIYSVTITNIGGSPLSGVEVTLYTSSGEKVNDGTTSTSGSVRFRDLAAGTYDAWIDDSTLPTGYTLDDNWVTLTVSSKSAKVIATSSIITNEDIPSSLVYSVGDVIYDFTITCYNDDGTTYEVTLSEYLEEYKAVLLNFFYTGCDPCKQEVPAMEQAYASYSDKVGLIAFDYTGKGDAVSNMLAFKTSYNLTFDFCYDSDGYYYHYNTNAFPTTVIIDRYGIIAEINTGSNTSASSWISMFEYYISDSYEPSYTTSKRDDSSSSLVESDVTMPDSDDIVAAIVTTNTLTDKDTFTFSNYSEDGIEDVYNWPWIIGEEKVSGVSDYIMTSNAGIVGGYSIIVIDVTLKKGQAVMFDYFVSTEDDYDIFYVQVDTILQLETSGLSTSWQTCLAYVAQYNGDYQITLYYQKDSSKNVNDDTVYVSNLRVVNSSEITSSSSISTDILYSAATNYADSSVDVSAYGEGYGYYNYVSVYLASDGYYRVDLDGNNKDGDAADEDDPYLLADLYYATPWYSELSVWYEVYGFGTSEINTTLAGCTSYGDPYDAFEDYAWTQNNCPLGYAPVNVELHNMLVAFVAAYGRDTGNLLDEQWLEVCRYYIHYGADHDSDKCYSLENAAETYGIRYAKALGEIDASANYDNDTAYVFTAEMETILVPRGNYYSFTVSKSGVYRIYSYNIETDSDAAPYAFLMDSDGNTLDSSEGDDLAYVDGFTRSYAAGSIAITGGTYTFEAKYSGTYTFTLTSGAAVAIYSADNTTCYLESGKTSFELELEAGTEYTFNLSGDTSATLDYEITSDTYEFALYAYLTAGETYYVGCSFGSTEETGSYDVGIYYIGEELTYLATLATGSYYTYYEVTDSNGNVTSYVYYLPTRISRTSYALNDEDNCWYTLDSNGDYDQLIYIDMVGVTWWNYYSNYTLQQTIENGLFVYDEDTNPDGWTITQVAVMRKYLSEALSNAGTVDGITAGTNSLNGLVPAYADLVGYINTLINGGTESSATTYADNAWMLTAYYVRTVGADS